MASPSVVIKGQITVGREAVGRNGTAEAGLWSALITTAAIIAFDAAVAIGFAGPDMAVPAVAASLAIAPAFVALMVSLHRRAPAQYRVWTGIGVAYAGIYATLIIFNYMLQLTVVRHNPSDFAWLSMALTGNTAFWVFETFGYAFMSLGAVFALPALTGTRFGRVLAWLFGLNLATALAGAAVYVATSDPVHPVILFGLGAWGGLFPVGTALIAVQFWSDRRNPSIG